MRHPRERAFESLIWSRRFVQQLISFERSLAFGNNHEGRAEATQTRHLQITGVLTDVGIEERTLLVRLFEVASGDDVIEDHRNAQRANLDRLTRSCS